MTHALLNRRPHTPPPALHLLGDLRFALSRAHEICGQARRTLALWIAAQTGGPVIWIAPTFGADPLNPDGVRAYTRPEQILFVTARRSDDLLWSMEEALRAGAVPLVVADLPAPPALTPVRRLHLAAESATERTGTRALGLILTPGNGGAPGVESRWRLDPRHSPGTTEWQLERLRARSDPPRRWRVKNGEQGLCLTRAQEQL